MQTYSFTFTLTTNFATNLSQFFLQQKESKCFGYLEAPGCITYSTKYNCIENLNRQQRCHQMFCIASAELKFVDIAQQCFSFVHIKTKFKFCKINKIPKNNSYSSGFNFLRGKLRLHPHLLSPGCWVTHLSTAVAWREKNSKHFVFCKYFCLILKVS